MGEVCGLSLRKVREGFSLNPFIFDIIFFSDPFLHTYSIRTINSSIAIRETTREVADRAILVATFLFISSYTAA